jgi:hypothetical protein
VSISSLIPGLRGTGSHRGKTPAQLRRELDAALCDLSALATRVGELTVERNQLEGQLDEAGIDLSGARHDLRIAGQEQKRLQDAIRAWEAKWANAFPVSVQAPRDLRPADDRPTVPTDVSSVRAVHRVIPITERPDAANPANIPAA